MSITLKLASTEEDFKFLYKVRTSEEVDKMLLGDPPPDYDTHENYILIHQGMDRYIFIASTENDNFGYAQCYDVTDDTVEVGFAISPEYQSKGLGKKLVKATVEKSMEMFPDKKVILYVIKENKVAIHVYKKMGFVVADLPLSSEDLIGMVYQEE